MVTGRTARAATRILPVWPRSARMWAGAGAAATSPGEHFDGCGPVLDDAGGDEHGDEQAEGVDHDVVFDAVDLLGAVEAAGSWHRCAIDGAGVDHTLRWAAGPGRLRWARRFGGRRGDG